MTQHVGSLSYNARVAYPSSAVPTGTYQVLGFAKHVTSYTKLFVGAMLFFIAIWAKVFGSDYKGVTIGAHLSFASTTVSVWRDVSATSAIGGNSARLVTIMVRVMCCAMRSAIALHHVALRGIGAFFSGIVIVGVLTNMSRIVECAMLTTFTGDYRAVGGIGTFSCIYWLAIAIMYSVRLAVLITAFARSDDALRCIGACIGASVIVRLFVDVVYICYTN